MAKKTSWLFPNEVQVKQQYVKKSEDQIENYVIVCPSFNFPIVLNLVSNITYSTLFGQ